MGENNSQNNIKISEEENSNNKLSGKNGIILNPDENPKINSNDSNASQPKKSNINEESNFIDPNTPKEDLLDVSLPRDYEKTMLNKKTSTNAVDIVPFVLKLTFDVSKCKFYFN